MKVPQTLPPKGRKHCPWPWVQKRKWGTRGIQLLGVQRGAERSWYYPVLWEPSRRAETRAGFWNCHFPVYLWGIWSTSLCPSFEDQLLPPSVCSPQDSPLLKSHTTCLSHSGDKCLMWQHTVICVFISPTFTIEVLLRETACGYQSSSICDFCYIQLLPKGSHAFCVLFKLQ